MHGKQKEAKSVSCPLGPPVFSEGCFQWKIECLFYLVWEDSGCPMLAGCELQRALGRAREGWQTNKMTRSKVKKLHATDQPKCPLSEEAEK